MALTPQQQADYNATIKSLSGGTVSSSDQKAGLLDTPYGTANYNNQGGIAYSNQGGYPVNPVVGQPLNLESTTKPAPGTPGSGTNAAGVPDNQPALSPEQQLINSNYDSIINQLNNLQGSAQSGYNSITSGINSGYDTSGQNLQRSNDAGVAQINQQQAEGDQRKQDALIAARRLYNELIMGGQQRFGGSSSAGEAYAALTGRELQRNNQSTQNDYSTFMGQVATAKNNLQVQFQNATATLEQQRQSALQQAQRDYQSQLDQINNSKVQAGTDKNNAQLSALQQLRNNVFQINIANAQNSSTLQDAMKQAQDQLTQYETQLNSAQGQVTQGQQAFNNSATTNPTSQLSMGNQQAGGPVIPTGQIASTQTNRDQYGNLLYANA